MFLNVKKKNVKRNIHQGNKDLNSNQEHLNSIVHMDISSSCPKSSGSRKNKNEVVFGKTPVLSSILFFKEKVNAVSFLTPTFKFQMRLLIPNP